jgi:two-component sensor histidine kinase
MQSTALSRTPAFALAKILHWRRVRFTLLAALPFALMITLSSTTAWYWWVLRGWTVALAALLVFGMLETWPTKLPPWMARWVLQLLGMVIVIPFAAYAAFWWTTGEFYFIDGERRRNGFAMLLFMNLFFAPWIALAAMLRQREAFARDQALAFALERSELERKATDARLHLMQAQVQPHFLFNTLANVRALVDAGSPRASQVLDSLIAYLRAAVPRLNDAATTVAQELELVRAYLDLMHMRMPDRLQFSLHVDEAAKTLRCPPMTILTLVENAVRHGIDPSEDGGRIEVAVQLHNGRCIARVSDTGVGLQSGSSGLGTGLSTLRERLQLAFGGDAQLRVAALTPHGVCAEVEYPAQPVHA